MSETTPGPPVYDAWASDMTEDVGSLRLGSAREAEGPIVVELDGGGAGRVAIEVVRETGKPVLGIDCSPAMLEGRPGACGRAARSSCATGDMRGALARGARAA